MISTAQVFWVALFTALATGLGALPVLFLKNSEPRWRGIAAATASGMMLSASVFALADEALGRGGAAEVVGGMLAGALFFSYTSRIIEERGWTIQGLNETELAADAAAAADAVHSQHSRRRGDRRRLCNR